MSQDLSSTPISTQYSSLTSISRAQVDTIGLRFPITVWAQDIPDSWTWNSNEKKAEIPTQTRKTFILKHLATGLRIGGTEEGAYWAEFSLPRFYFGDNARLLTCEEFARAKEAVDAVISEICPLYCSGNVKVSRIDPVIV